ncbi:hypothetical protein RB195_019250 [Necator americanus]|uniref:Alpha-mannosidase n=1 Tax=Necator americanus TaxID=51031 RepID=A0ABR1CFA9_NECAM
MLVRSALVRRRRWSWLVLLAILVSTAFIFYTIDMQSRTAVQRSKRVPLTEFEYSEDVRGEMDLSSDLSYGVCSSSPQNNMTSEIDTFEVYRDHIAHGVSPPDSEIQRLPSRDKLKVFVLPFTHVDPGWLQTFESYSKDTDSILSNMHRFMTSNRNMTFMWAELIFFEKWWSKQNISVKDDVRGLVKSGRLELASGSWVMTDEANVYYPVTVDNIVEGHQFLYEEFDDVKHTVVWSNDPFGYSNSVPYIFTQAGIKRAVINRVHHDVKRYLQKRKAIPFEWRQYFDPNGSSGMLTHVLPYTHYDILNSCGPNPGICCEFDFKRITHFSCPGTKPVPITSANVATKARALVSQLHEMAQMYESNVLLMVHGDDFRYNMIEEWHQQHDNFLPLFEEINRNELAEIRFGTFSDYFDALEKWYADNGKKPVTLSGDFFPYKCAMGDIWTGYFSTRPFIKKRERSVHNIIRAADIIAAQAESKMNVSLRKEVKNKLRSARRILNLIQHHDAITGTSRKHVMADYSALLHNASNFARAAFEAAAGFLAGSKVYTLEYSGNHTETETIALIKTSEVGTVTINVFNSLPYNVEDVVTLRVDSVHVALKNDEGDVAAQIEPFIHHGEISKDEFLLCFRCHLRALSTSSFTLRTNVEHKSTSVVNVFTHKDFYEHFTKVLPKVFQLKVITSKDFMLKNKQLKTSHDERTGLLTHVSTTATGRTQVRTEFHKYESAFGGAYLMRVQQPSKPHATGNTPRFITKGLIQQNAHLFLQNIYEKITIKNVEGSFGQQVHLFLRVDIRGTTNTEMLIRFVTDLQNPMFYADSAGMQLMRRQRYDKLSAPANFYPMPSAAVLDDQSKRITIASNLAHGVSPNTQQGADVILDRMLNQDDGKGLGTGPDSLPTDILPVEMRFSLLIEKVKTPERDEYSTYHTLDGHLAVQGILYPPVVTMSSSRIPSLRLRSALPCNLHLLTIRAVGNGKQLLSIYNSGVVCRTDSAAFCSGDLQKWLVSYLRALNVAKVQETNLAGVTPLSKEISVNDYIPTVEPYKFLSLLLSFSH